MAQEAQTEHTPLPWRRGFGQTHKEKYIDIYGSDYRRIAKLLIEGENRAEQDANADLILKAVHGHAALTAGLESAMASIQQLVDLKMIPANNKGLRDGRAALDKVRAA